MSTPRGYRDLAAGIGLVLALVVPAAAGDEPPRFEGGVEMVAVDANVVDGKGRPIPDLTAEEFVVRVDGKPRRVLSAELVRVDGGALPAEQPATAGSAAPPKVPLGLRPAARLFILVVDRGQIEGSVDQAATSAARLLDQLGPGDRVAVFTLPSGPRIEFTADRAAVESVLRKIGPIPHRFMGEFNISYAEALALQGGRSRSNGVVNRECELALKQLERPHAAEACEQRVEQEAHRQVEEHERSVEDRLSALESLCRNLAQVPGTKSLVLISGGFTAALADGRAKVAHQLRDIASAAAASKVNFYSIYFSHRVDAFDASRAREQFTPEEDRRLQSAGLEELTGMTGGAFYEAVAGANFAFERVASETSAHYLLGLEPGRSDRDGKPHAIDVKVLRKGAEVRARRQFVMEASVGRPFPIPRPTAPPVAPSPLRVSTHVLRGDLPEQIKVLMTAQADGFADARFDIKILDPRGATVGALTEQVTPKDGGPVRHQETIVLPRGLYTLKAEALESGGRRAAIEAPLNAELGHAVGFDLSDLMLLEPANGALRLSAAAAIVGDRMGIYLEVYVQDQLPTDQLGVTVEVVDARGARRSSTLASVREDPAKGLVYAEGVVDLKGLPPGGYVARAVVTSGLKVARRLERAFTIAAADRAALQAAKASKAP